MLITFLVNSYRKIMNVILIALVIILPVVGGIVGKIFSTLHQNYIILGVLLGLAAVLILEFLILPPFFAIFEINRKLQEPVPQKKMNTSDTKKEEVKFWECTHCGACNPLSETRCQSCHRPK